MNLAYLNGKFLPREEIHISPDDRGFLFADGIYEVVRWYQGFFFDMEGHISRLKRSLREVRIGWKDPESFNSIASELIIRNELGERPTLVYLQVTRGVAKRAHAFPDPPVEPTVYAFARSFHPDAELIGRGIGAILRNDWRWTRCDIKSVSLLPNILSFQEARESGCYECIFSRDGIITECAHSNIFFVLDGILMTHPESNFVLSGISRKNIISLAKNAGIPLKEEALPVNKLKDISEAFVTNTSFEIAPVISIDNVPVGSGKPGPVAKLLREKFNEALVNLKG